MSEESRETPALPFETIRYATRMLWYVILVYLDFQTTLYLTGDVTYVERRSIILKSVVLIALVFCVVIYSQRE